MLPAHLQPVVALGRSGVAVRLAVAGAPVPPRPAARQALLVIGDDLQEAPGSLGPRAYDGAALRAWCAALAPAGGIGIFAGAPNAEAYRALSLAALVFPGGAVIVECSESTFVDWARYCDAHAPHAVRLDVAPPIAPVCAYMKTKEGVSSIHTPRGMLAALAGGTGGAAP